MKTYFETMNKPFVPERVVPILADVSVSISDLKRNPAAVVEAARKQQVAILNRGRAVAYVISPEVWDGVVDMIENLQDERIVKERLANPGPRIRVKVEDLV